MEGESKRMEEESKRMEEESICEAGEYVKMGMGLEYWRHTLEYTLIIYAILLLVLEIIQIKTAENLWVNYFQL